MNRRLFPWLIGLSLVFFVVAPILIVRAPLEQEMGLIQKIFYFHFSAWMAMYLSICVLGISSAQFLFRRKPAADRLAVSAAEAALVFGLMGLITGPIWAVKSWVTATNATQAMLGRLGIAVNEAEARQAVARNTQQEG